MKSAAVNHPAVGPDLAGASSERADVPHLYHGGGEVRGEECRVSAVPPYQRVLRPAVEELLVRVQ
jgi:hypothetical protein